MEKTLPQFNPLWGSNVSVPAQVNISPKKNMADQQGLDKYHNMKLSLKKELDEIIDKPLKNEAQNKPSLRKKDAETSYILGMRYYTGNKVPAQSIQESVNHLKRAAERGDPDASFMLGRIYRDAEYGIAQDITSAVEYFERAAENGHPGAYNALGDLHREEYPDHAVKYYEKSVYQNGKGDLDSVKKILYNIGVGYQYGNDGFEENIDKAVIYYNLAAKDRHAPASYMLGYIHENGAKPDSTKNIKGVEENIDEAVEHYEIAANDGYGPALNALGVVYLDGAEANAQRNIKGVDKNKKTALGYFNKAVSKGYFHAYKNMALLYKSIGENALAAGCYQAYLLKAKGKINDDLFNINSRINKSIEKDNLLSQKLDIFINPN